MKNDLSFFALLRMTLFLNLPNTHGEDTNKGSEEVKVKFIYKY